MGNIIERLFSLIRCTDTTGKGFQALVLNVLESNGLNPQNCIANSTDGAANMQGEYNDFSANMQNLNSDHVHIWCYSHILNLVLCDILNANLKAASLFSLLNSISSFFKESYQRMNIWESNNSTDSKQRKIQSIGATRWWAKELALKKIFGDFNKPENSLYVVVIDTLEKIEKNDKINPDTRVTAKNHKDNLLKYENIITAQIFLKIFSITGPLSRYLQTRGLDLLKCNHMLETTIEQLRSIQRDFISIQEATNTFLRWAKLELESKDIDADIQEHFTNVRRRYVKKFYEEKSIDEQPQSPEERFKISTFNVLMDIAVEAMNNRFLKNMDICRDMAILDPNNFEEICNKKSLPDNCMKYLSAKIIKYNSTATSSQLKEELLSFASNWEKLKLTLEDTYKTNYDLDLHIIEDDYDDEDGIDTVNLPNSSEITDVKLKKNICKSCKNCAICCYTVILKYNMFQGAYCALATAYQYLLTLPITQVECERSFSVLKYIKNRLRNRLTNDQLESFVIMNLEKSTLNTVDNEEVINSLAAESSLLKKPLIS